MLDGCLYAVGGHDGPLVRKSVEVYTPETNSWVQVADMHLCRRNAGKLKKTSFCPKMSNIRYFLSKGYYSLALTIKPRNKTVNMGQYSKSNTS